MSWLGLLPVALTILTAGAFILSYVLAVLRDDVTPLFPYISDTGADRPESCIFGQLLNMSAFVAFFVMYLRYKAVQAIVAVSDIEESVWLARMNKAGLVLGLIASFGVSVVANFQEGTVVEPVHFTGAALAFGPGTLYCFLQTALSYHMAPRYNGLFVCRMRLFITLLCVAAFIVMTISGSIAFNKWNSEIHSPDKFKWKPTDPGYKEHITSTMFEWVLAFGFFCFFLTYAREFNKFEVEVVTRPLVRHLDELLEASVQVRSPYTTHLPSSDMESFSNTEYLRERAERARAPRAYGNDQRGSGEPDERTKLLG